MVKITSKDIEILREYLDKLEVLEQEKPQNILTAEEWDEIFKSLFAFGEVPDKYKGRVGESEILIHSDIVDGKHQYYTEGIKKKAYYDIVEEEYNQRITLLNNEYHDIIRKALQFYIQNLEEKPEQTENQAEEWQTTSNIIAEILENPEVKRVLEKELKAGKFSRIAPLGSVPNGDPLNFLYRVMNASKGGRMVEASNGNRHEVITTQLFQNSLTFTRENKQNGSTVIVEIAQADKYLSKTNKTFTKVLLFTLQKMTAQNFPLEVGFSLQELVDLGMYSTTSNAGRAVKAFFEQQKLTTLSGTVKKGRKTVKEEGGVLFYHYKINNGFVTLSVNENFNLDFIASYFTVFPRFAYALSNNAFSLVRYIFFLARQNTQAIKDKGTFTISLENIRENLGLPSVDEVKNRKYRQFIIEPIEKAIEETEEALLSVPEAKEYGFTITPVGTETSSIEEWLQGYLEIGLNGDFAETFVKLAEKAEQERKQWERIKKAELAKIAARQEAKEAQEKPTRKRKK